ncbi:MAG: hypothetical protein SPK06_06135 [Kiritimatiellia bacterium]|nr:hypothetical protein [Kiritimatiellia bacterium]
MPPRNYWLLAGALAASATLSAPVEILPANGSYLQTFETLRTDTIWSGDNCLPAWTVLNTSCAFKSGTAGGLRAPDIGTGKTLGGLAVAAKAVGFALTLHNAREQTLKALPLTFDAFCSRTNSGATRLVLTAKVTTSEPDINDESDRFELFSYGISDHAGRATLSCAVPLEVPSGHYLQLRWKMDALANSDTLGIDNVRLIWEKDLPLANPEENSEGAQDSPLPEPVAVSIRGYRQGFDGGAGSLSELTSLPAGWAVAKSATVCREPCPELGVREVSGANQYGTNAVVKSGASLYPADVYFYAPETDAEGMILLQEDRALGGRCSSGLRGIQFFFRGSNATSRVVSSWHLEYALECYRSGANAAMGMVVYASSDGVLWRVAGTNGLPSGGVAVWPQPVSEAVSMEVDLEVGAGDEVWLAWVMGPLEGSTASNAPDVAIDEVWLRPVSSAPLMMLLE